MLYGWQVHEPPLKVGQLSGLEATSHIAFTSHISIDAATVAGALLRENVIGRAAVNRLHVPKIPRPHGGDSRAVRLNAKQVRPSQGGELPPASRPTPSHFPPTTSRPSLPPCPSFPPPLPAHRPRVQYHHVRIPLRSPSRSPSRSPPPTPFAAQIGGGYLPAPTS